MKKTFNYYCDESTHLENDQMPYMLIAYVSTAYNQMSIHKEFIKNLKKKHRFKGEFKWTGISKHKYPFYAELLDYFFSTDLRFRAIIIDKSQIDPARPDFSFNDFYFRMYYQLLTHKISDGHTCNIYLDVKDTNSNKKLKNLHEVLNHSACIGNIQFIRSYESTLMQLTDVMMGAINYHLRGLSKVIAKNKIIEKIKRETSLDLKKSTTKEADKFNLFHIDLK